MSDGHDQSPRDPSPREIERAIARTRTDLSQTIDALERKLAVRQFVEKGFDMFTNRFAGSDGLNRGIEAIRANPVPVALIGIGAAWLVASNTGVVDRLAHDERVESMRRRVSDFAGTVGDRAGEMASSVADTVGFHGSQSASERPLGHTGNPLVDQPGSSANGWMHQVTGMAQDTLRSARDAVVEGPVGSNASRIADQVSDALQQHPLAVGAVGVMAGMLIAALLPMTKTETELLGDTSSQLWQKAREAGEDVVTRVRQTATQAASQVASKVTEQAIEAAAGHSSHSSEEANNGPATSQKG